MYGCVCDRVSEIGMDCWFLSRLFVPIGRMPSKASSNSERFMRSGVSALHCPVVSVGTTATTNLWSFETRCTPCLGGGAHDGPNRSTRATSGAVQSVRTLWHPTSGSAVLWERRYSSANVQNRVVRVVRFVLLASKIELAQHEPLTWCDKWEREKRTHRINQKELFHFNIQTFTT